MRPHPDGGGGAGESARSRGSSRPSWGGSCRLRRARANDECNGDGHNPEYEAQLATKIVDSEGAEITAYLFGDNYFELYANGEYVGRDAVGFTPFNSHVARFQVEYPVTYAVLLVDWEGYLGVGLEDSRRRIHIGDGGFIAAFSDGAATDGSWRCRAFYVAPLDDPGCIVVGGAGNPDSSGCPATDESVSCIANDPTTTCRAAHFPLPDDWMSAGYDDSGWLPAATYTAADVTRSPAFRDYEDTLFQGAEFIWTSSLELDRVARPLSHPLGRLLFGAPIDSLRARAVAGETVPDADVLDAWREVQQLCREHRTRP